MSVRPVAFDVGGITVIHDEENHGGTLAFTDLSFPTRVTGGVDRRFIVIPCPFAGCDAVSVHPLGGGAAPRPIQRLFAHMLRRLAVAGTLPPTIVSALNLPDGDVSTWELAKAKLRILVERMDGPGRFQINDVNENDS